MKEGQEERKNKEGFWKLDSKGTNLRFQRYQNSKQEEEEEEGKKKQCDAVDINMECC